MIGNPEYRPEAIARARDAAIQWLEAVGSAAPRSRKQEAVDTERRGYRRYGNFEAPPILGYEALEAEGIISRDGEVFTGGEHRILFTLVPGKLMQARDM